MRGVMIELYSWPTPNGHKIHIMLEETGLPYRLHPIDIGKGEQFQPEFLKINPNNKIPAILDPDGPGGKPLPLFESGAILLYLAEKTGKFLPASPQARYETLQWLFFQMGGVGPMLGQLHHFLLYAPEPIPYALDRYRNEARRLYGVLDHRLQDREYVAGPYSIADMALFPWLRIWERQQMRIQDYPHLLAWLERVAARPAVRRGVAVLADHGQSGQLTAEARENLFGTRQFERRG